MHYSFGILFTKLVIYFISLGCGYAGPNDESIKVSYYLDWIIRESGLNVE